MGRGGVERSGKGSWGEEVRDAGEMRAWRGVRDSGKGVLVGEECWRSEGWWGVRNAGKGVLVGEECWRSEGW